MSNYIAPTLCSLDTVTYNGSMNWKEFLESGKTLNDVSYDPSWIVMFSQMKKKNKYDQIIKNIKEQVENDKRLNIFPKPQYLFSAFLLCPATELKVVFIGQDPYFNMFSDEKNKINVPEAYGLSFSVPNGVKIPSSLKNIYTNLLQFKHIDEMPKSGNLWFWAIQGCLMLNTALTVKHGEKKSHYNMWQWFTDDIIIYINKYFKNIVFVLWGGDAYKKIDLINQDYNHVIVSSHPSGLSASTPMQKYPAFKDFDHFGEINKILKENNIKPILWK